MLENYICVKVKLILRDFQTEENVQKIIQKMDYNFDHAEILSHEVIGIHNSNLDNKKSKVVLFSRPVAVEDVTYEVRVPDGLTEQEEIDWIMNHRDRVQCVSSRSERYGLPKEEDPNLWEDWSVTIDPALNVLEEDSEENNE